MTFFQNENCWEGEDLLDGDGLEALTSAFLVEKFVQ
jgi:hypothetical protein